MEEKAIITHLDKTWRLLKRSMSPRTFRYLKTAYFAGGCIRSLITGSIINDYDIFFESFGEAIKFQELAEKDKTVWKHFKKVWKSTNAYTIIHKKTKEKFQFIRADSGSLYDVIGRFDYTINMAAYRPFGKLLFIPYLKDILDKRLVCTANPTTPVSALLRSYKFIKEGYSISALEAMKALINANKSSRLDSVEELKTQLKIEKSTSLLSEYDVSELFKFVS